MKTNTRRVYLSRLIFFNFKCVHFIVFKLFHNKEKEEEKRTCGIFRVMGGVAEGETKVWKQNNNDALDGREGRIKINSSFWLGWFTVRYYSLWEIVFLGTGLCVVGGVGQRRYKAEF